ncbi:hypothetical protein K503DRAFT_345571 [Rhizopogon vinicolor AM-OR11-026]|uniref:Uncharacterized protein n=1 Tax=Rhizopogon vinicolor AM-OR11-026 TaxID=1314800 RepID=A0A1B7MT26_9AGAM|nr:hypothetical protein K503DRAFT_345571 [Rhizopogon vinicolor AM-OR11-026]
MARGGTVRQVGSCDIWARMRGIRRQVAGTVTKVNVVVSPQSLEIRRRRRDEVHFIWRLSPHVLLHSGSKHHSTLSLSPNKGRILLVDDLGHPSLLTIATYNALMKHADLISQTSSSLPLYIHSSMHMSMGVLYAKSRQCRRRAIKNDGRSTQSCSTQPHHCQTEPT